MLLIVGGKVWRLFGLVLDRDAQCSPPVESKRYKGKQKKGGRGSKLYILSNFDEKYVSKYDIFLIFC